MLSNRSLSIRTTVASAAIALGALALAAPVSAAPSGPALALKAAAPASGIEQVQFRRGYRGGYYRGGRGIGIGAGIVGGAIIGSMLAAPRYYGPYYGRRTYYYDAPPPARVYVAPPDDAISYCMSRFRSYDPASGTYLGYDGYRHPCP